VRHVAQHRFLTTQHFQKLVKGGEQGIVRRLHTLYHAGVLDRPRAQLEYFHRTGSKPMVYGLGPHGARMLCERGERSKIDWTAKNRDATRLFIEHTLRVADFMVDMEVACRDSGIRMNRVAQRLQWTAPVVQGGVTRSVGVIPDALFEIQTADQQKVLFCLEADRATMPVKRRHLNQTSVHRKLLAYHATWKHRILNQHYTCKRFRVLTLTTSAERVRNLREAARELPNGHGLFLFAHEGQLKTASNALLMPWQEPRSEKPVMLRADC
jgi:hypothetical protein